MIINIFDKHNKSRPVQSPSTFGPEFTSGSFSQVVVATTVFTVTIGSRQTGTTYKVNISPASPLAAAPYYITNKTLLSFDVTYLAPLTGTVAFDWLVS